MWICTSLKKSDATTSLLHSGYGVYVVMLDFLATKSHLAKKFNIHFILLLNIFNLLEEGFSMFSLAEMFLSSRRGFYFNIPGK